MSTKKTQPKDPPVVQLLMSLKLHNCCHPPACGHTRYSQCRDALVAAIAAIDLDVARGSAK